MTAPSPELKTSSSTNKMHTLLAVHAEDGITEFEAPGKTPQQAVNSEKAIQIQDDLIDEYGDNANCAILPAGTSQYHPLVDAIDESMPDLDIRTTLRHY